MSKRVKKSYLQTVETTTFESWMELYCNFKFKAWEVIQKFDGQHRNEVRETMEFAKEKDSYLNIGVRHTDIDGNTETMYSQADVYEIEYLCTYGDGG